MQFGSTEVRVNSPRQSGGAAPAARWDCQVHYGEQSVEQETRRVGVSRFSAGKGESPFMPVLLVRWGLGRLGGASGLEMIHL